MTGGNEIIHYKQKAISMLVNCKSIVELIDNNIDNCGSSEELIYKNVFPYICIPETVMETSTYIALKVDIPNTHSERNYSFQQVVITFYIIAHQSKMKTEYGATRIDCLGKELYKLFENSQGFGSGKLIRISDIEDSVNNMHRCRIIKFQSLDSKMGMCGGKW